MFSWNKVQKLLHCFDSLGPVGVINLGQLGRGFIIGFIVHLLMEWMDSITSDVCQNPGALDSRMLVHEVPHGNFEIGFSQSQDRNAGVWHILIPMPDSATRTMDGFAKGLNIRGFKKANLLKAVNTLVSDDSICCSSCKAKVLEHLMHLILHGCQ